MSLRTIVAVVSLLSILLTGCSKKPDSPVKKMFVQTQEKHLKDEEAVQTCEHLPQGTVALLISICEEGACRLSCRPIGNTTTLPLIWRGSRSGYRSYLWYKCRSKEESTEQDKDRKKCRRAGDMILHHLHYVSGRKVYILSSEKEVRTINYSFVMQGPAD